MLLLEQRDVMKQNFLYSFYSSTLLCEVSVPPLYAAMPVGVVGFVASIIVPFIIDKVHTVI